MWHPAQDKVYYRQDEESFARLDLVTGKKDVLDGRLRQLSPDGSSLAVVMAGSQDAAIGIVPDDGAQCRELVSREQLYDLTPNREEFRPEDMTLGNTKWRPDSQYILVAMWLHSHPKSRRSLYIVSRDGLEARWLTHFRNHHSWTPDGAHVLLNDWMPVGAERGKREPRMFLVTFGGSNRRVAFDGPIGSHPLMHPNGRSIVDADSRGVYVVRVDENRVERLATFSRYFDGTHHGTHPHPTWNHDGGSILYNSAETGHSEIYHIVVKT